jgi:hypothetical protein
MAYRFGLSCRSAAAAPSWAKLAGFEAGRKENVQKAGAWAGQRLRQAAAHSAPAAPALEVFADPELQVGGNGGDSFVSGVLLCGVASFAASAVRAWQRGATGIA